MRCSVCGKDKNKNYFTTIVHNPPIDICGECMKLIIKHLENCKGVRT